MGVLSIHENRVRIKEILLKIQLDARNFKFTSSMPPSGASHMHTPPCHDPKVHTYTPPTHACSEGHTYTPNASLPC